MAKKVKRYRGTPKQAPPIKNDIQITNPGKDRIEPVAHKGNGTTQIALLAAAMILGLIFIYIGGAHFLESGERLDRHIVDDAGITYNFSRNLADGFGVVLVPGGERVEGYSDPLWMLIIAAGYKAGIDAFVLVRKLAFILGLLVIAFPLLFALRAFPERKIIPAVTVPLLLGTHAALAIWSFTGLENTLYLLLLLLGTYRLFRECDDTVKTDLPMAPVLFFLMSVTRPEGVAYFAFAASYRVLARIWPARKIDKQDLLWFGAFLIPWGAYQIWHYLYFAYPLSNTYYGKLQPRTWAQVFDKESYGYNYVSGYLKGYKISVLFPLVPFAFFVRGRWKAAAFLFACFAFALFFPLYANGDWMNGYRFCSMVAPLLFLSAAMGVAGIVDLFEWATKNGNKIITVSLALALSLVFAGGYYKLLLPSSNREMEKYLKKPAARVSRGIKRRAEYFREQAKKLRFRDYEATLVDMDMGATSLYSKMGIVDVGRICDVPFAHHFFDKKHLKRFAEEYVLDERNAEFTHLRRAWGEGTTLPGNPRYKRDYFYLPDAKNLKPHPAGNYVRKDLFMYQDHPAGYEPISFSPGVVLLHSALTPDVTGAGGVAWLRNYWRKGNDAQLPILRFRVVLEDSAGRFTDLKRFQPIMGWVPTDNWADGQIYGEWVSLEIPEHTPPGRYKLSLEVIDRNTNVELDEKPIALVLVVDNELADQKGAETIEDALAKIEAGDLATALGLYDQGAQYFSDKIPPMTAAKFENALIQKAADLAREWINQGENEKAEDALILTRKRVPRAKQVNALLWKLSKQVYQKGKTAEKNSDFDLAYRLYSRACKLQPHNAWARKKAENVRTKRY